MRLVRAPWRRFLPVGLLSFVLLGLAGCTDGSKYPQSTLHPKGDFAAMVDEVFMTTVWLALIVFIVVEGGLLWAIWRFRAKPNDARPKQIHGSTVVEIIWTVIPAVVLAFVAVPTIKTIFATANVPAASPGGEAPLKVEVVGHQWWWEFRYPEYGITTANQMHVPVGRTVDLRMKSVDVLHAFWIPQVTGKRDVFPNRETRLWFTALETGEFPGACTEFCGLQHARMDLYVMSQTPEEFAAWVALRKRDPEMSGAASTGTGHVTVDTIVRDTMSGTAVAAARGPDALPTDAEQAAPVPGDPRIAEGKALFTKKACAGCHSLNSIDQPKRSVGPNLAGIGVRKMIAGGWLPNTDLNLKRWIMHPQDVKPGVAMKGYTLSDAEADAIVAYLRTKR
ncbi:MAG: cytochrome c oxidase subunit II [Gemmatimonadales bacterium]|nr:cytochrome c oxidase subunit II [Gemmatimonadales bacterium]